MPFSRSAFALYGCALLTLAAPVLSADKPLPPVGKLPPHTVFLARSRFGTVYATGSYYASVPGRLYFQRPDQRLVSVPNVLPEAVTFSADGQQITTWGNFTSSVWRTSDLHLSTRLPHLSYGWWDGNRLGYLASEDYMSLGGKRFRGVVRLANLVTADTSGHYFLGVREIGPGTEANGSCPVQRVTLWHRTAGTRFQRVRKSWITQFDPFGGYPCHLAVLNKGTFVFGQPTSGGLGYDWLFAYRNGHRVRVPEYGNSGGLLFANQQPLIIGDTIVGLARNSMATRRYLYRLLDTGFYVHPVAANVTFVIYDARRGVGLGVSTRTGTSIVYKTCGKLPQQ